MPGYSNPQNLNRYSYVTNNPLRYIDPTGHKPACGVYGEGCGEDELDALTGGGGGNGGGGGGNNDEQEEPGHDYLTVSLGCLNLAWIDCTAEEMAYYMSQFQYPGQPPWSPVIDESNYDVWPASLWGIPNLVLWVLGMGDSGAITVDIDDNNPLTITNVTKETHIFNVGDVTRKSYQLEDGNWYVVTQGGGTNDGYGILPGPFLDDVNDVAGSAVFTVMNIELLAYTTAVETGQYIEAQVSSFFP